MVSTRQQISSEWVGVQYTVHAPRSYITVPPRCELASIVRYLSAILQERNRRSGGGGSRILLLVLTSRCRYGARRQARPPKRLHPVSTFIIPCKARMLCPRHRMAAPVPMLRLIASPAPASLRPAVPLSSSCPCCADALRGLQDQYLFLRYHNGRKHGPVVACGYPCAGSCTGAVQLRRLSLRMRLAFATYRLRGRAWRQRDQSFVGGWFLRYCLGCFIRRLWLGSAGLCGLWHFSMGFGCSMAWFHARSLRPSRERRRVVRGVVCPAKRAASPHMGRAASKSSC